MSNFETVIDSSAARTATFNGNTASNSKKAGAFVLVDVTAASGTAPTLVAKVQFSVNGVDWHDLDTTNAQTASITTTGKYILKVYPGLTAAANSAANSPLPRLWRLVYTIGGSTPSFTFSTSAAYLT